MSQVALSRIVALVFVVSAMSFIITIYSNYPSDVQRLSHRLAGEILTSEALRYHTPSSSSQPQEPADFVSHYQRNGSTVGVLDSSDTAVFDRQITKTIGPSDKSSVHRPTFQCNVERCFDYNRCPRTSYFPIYIYPERDYNTQNDDRKQWKSALTERFHKQNSLTEDPNLACVFLVLVANKIGQHSKDEIRTMLQSLPFWGDNGINHIVVNTANNNIFAGADGCQAILVSSIFQIDNFRRDFDIIFPQIQHDILGDTWETLLPLMPLHRRYLLTFQSYLIPQYEDELKTSEINNLMKDLKMIQSLNENSISFSFTCSPDGSMAKSEYINENPDWNLCGTEVVRKELLSNSTFALIIAPPYPFVSTASFQTRMYEALLSGAIPVVLGTRQSLPFADVLPWEKVVIVVGKARVKELHSVIESISDNDIFEYKRQGRILWERHMRNTEAIFDTLLLTVKQRLGIPLPPAKDFPSINWLNASINNTIDSLRDAGTSTAHFSRRSPHDPFHAYRSTPFQPMTPLDNADQMGVMYPSKSKTGEQFTVVVLTFKRPTVMLETLRRLKGLPLMNQVLVVWNSRTPPDSTMHWPDIGVPIQVLKTPRNSLNNRFLPFDAIATEAVFSIDDDVSLPHSEILFAFRVWQENRDSLVGFPARHHDWNETTSQWQYNSSASCRLSIVLTGAAFLHKYYMYEYSYQQPQAITYLVDTSMNCEDIAMNFLISHLTRKPPIKVTPRSRFPCHSCSSALSNHGSHYRKRNNCLNFFAKIYGYMPLLYTRFRADSVLMKPDMLSNMDPCYPP